ncbi:hypothetical protein ACVGVM_18675 [Pseudonocardia bannensis]|uniref:Uncharacterized protein n=1 Tax=Pseudonocardia bannensis TaxID=630973 RepID=A0A848DHW8_9PSEU|nr:hypothetical protein [Pseudonocardia bannensis]NMH92278.1 hypothetical protein [Pseudonocardia bannensis]
MTVRLNHSAFELARRRVSAGAYVIDGRDMWDAHRPLICQENDFVALHGYDEYASWHLGIDDEHGEETKERYEFPYGDFERVHRCGVLAAESRAGQHRYLDIELATAHLHGMLDALGTEHHAHR